MKNRGSSEFWVWSGGLQAGSLVVGLYVKCVLALLCKMQALMGFRLCWVGGVRLSINV